MDKSTLVAETQQQSSVADVRTPRRGLRHARRSRVGEDLHPRHTRRQAQREVAAEATVHPEEVCETQAGVVSRFPHKQERRLKRLQTGGD